MTDTTTALDASAVAKRKGPAAGVDAELVGRLVICRLAQRVCS
jgi:hypothetical protein